MDLTGIYARQIVVAVGLVVFFLVGRKVYQVVLLISMTYSNVKKMPEQSKLFPAEGEGHAGQFEIVEGFLPWANAVGFDFVGAYTTEIGIGSFVAVWRHRQYPRYFELVFAGDNKAPSFTTVFREERDLDTCASDMGMFPSPPGVYKQWLPDLSVDDLYARHLEAEEYLTRVGSLQYEPNTAQYTESVRLEALRLSAYIQSLPLWPLRAPYWYFVARRRKINKTIEEQHKSGRILLPNDPGFREFQPDVASP